MNTTEFYQLAFESAKSFGYDNPSVTTISMCYKGEVKHSCQLYDDKKKGIINSGLHNNPTSAIQAFQSAIEFDNKIYSVEVHNIENIEQ